MSRTEQNPALAGARLTIDLDAVAQNWRTLTTRGPQAECAAVVKADGYGLGADKVGAFIGRKAAHPGPVA